VRSLLPKDRVEWTMVVGAVLLFGSAIVALSLFGVT